jgi:hypothetical protein
LEAGAVVGKLANAVKDQVNNLLSDRVVAAGIVVGSIFLSVDDLLRVIETLVMSSTDFVANSWFQVDVDGTRDVLATLGFTKERRERIVTATNFCGIRHGAIRFNAMLEAIEFLWQEKAQR